MAKETGITKPNIPSNSKIPDSVLAKDDERLLAYLKQYLINYPEGERICIDYLKSRGYKIMKMEFIEV